MKENSTPIWVAAAALLDDRARVLMQRRRSDRVHGGLWEFPGGKVEQFETPESTAIREIDEELGVAISRSALSPLSFASGQLPNGTPLVILLYTCRSWTGDPLCRDADEVEWFDMKQLISLRMPPLDYPLAEHLIRSLEMNRR